MGEKELFNLKGSAVGPSRKSLKRVEDSLAKFSNLSKVQKAAILRLTDRCPKTKGCVWPREEFLFGKGTPFKKSNISKKDWMSPFILEVPVPYKVKGKKGKYYRTRKSYRLREDPFALIKLVQELTGLDRGTLTKGMSSIEIAMMNRFFNSRFARRKSVKKAYGYARGLYSAQFFLNYFNLFSRECSGEPDEIYDSMKLFSDRAIKIAELVLEDAKSYRRHLNKYVDRDYNRQKDLQDHISKYESDVTEINVSNLSLGGEVNKK